MDNRLTSLGILWILVIAGYFVSISLTFEEIKAEGLDETPWPMSQGNNRHIELRPI